MSADAPELVDPIGALLAGWKRVALVTGICVAVAVTYALLAPKWYVATLVVVPSPSPRGGLPFLGGGGDLASAGAALSLASEFGLGGQSDIERIAAVFRSRTLADAVIKRFDLTTRYQEKYIEDTRKTLQQHCIVNVEKKPGLVALSCEDKSPKLALEMTQYFSEYGNQVFRQISATSAAEERRFLEQRVAEARRDMDEASRKLRDFRERNKVVNLSEQSKAVVSSMATLRAEMLAKEVQLSYLKSFSARDESSAGQLRRQVRALAGKLRALEESRTAAASQPTPPGKKQRGRKGAGSSGIFPPAMAVPQLQLAYEELFREQKIQETLFLLMTQRYEMARVSEARDTSTFQVLDAPVLPTKKSRPKRILMTLGGLVVGLIGGAVWVLGPPYYRTQRRRRARKSAAGDPPAS